MRPDTGQELWRQSLKALPRKHDCNLVDVNGDGLQDCLVVGDGGLLTAIEPRTGMLIMANYGVVVVKRRYTKKQCINL